MNINLLRLIDIFLKNNYLKDRQELRGNIEEQETYQNSIDPMRINVSWRDQFPKLGIDGIYVGDQYMLCADIPKQSYLRKGAQYQLLGRSPVSSLQNPHRQNDGTIFWLTIDPSSYLYSLLCKDDNTTGSCSYPSTLELQYSLQCTGSECDTEMVQIIKVNDIYYEYLKPPCVQFCFFEEGKEVMKRIDDGSEIIGGCADQSHALNVPYYSGHYVSTGQSCEVHLIVDIDGKIAISKDISTQLDSLTYFRVHWHNDIFPKQSDNCGNSCDTVQGRCRCVFKITDEIKFQRPPLRADILSQLSVGAPTSEMIDYDSMILSDDDVHIYFKVAKNTFDTETMFQVTDDFGRVIFLKNMESIVHIVSDDSMSEEFKFRNPPKFFNVIPELRDAHFETEAVLDHYIYHQNTAPFVALRLVQRFGISNPSPRFIATVADAFKKGKYVKQLNGKTTDFGSGEFGDLSATVAAILLDRESRHEVLESDYSFGSLREPLIRVISLLRGLEYKNTWSNYIALPSLNSQIGEFICNKKKECFI
jgi:cullin-associated NEDD8-dissociated protein 1